MLKSPDHKNFTVFKPAPGETVLPLIIDVPHSGQMIPDSFALEAICPKAELQGGEPFVDEIYLDAAQDLGATLLKSMVTRSYLDLNRAIDDLDPAMIDGTWPGGVRPTSKSRNGIGLIWRQSNAGSPIYDRLLSLDEIKDRIESVYVPYYAQLETLYDDLQARFGAVWHINAHSMPSSVSRGRLPDFVLGDYDGQTCHPDLTAFLAQALRKLGYSVSLNKPYRGMELVRRFSDPKAQRHAIQIEVNRDLYMDELLGKKTKGINKLKSNIHILIKELSAYMTQYIG